MMNDTKPKAEDRVVVKLTMFLEVDKKDVDTLKPLTHHIENLVDTDSWPEIKNIFDVTIEKL